jgi:hypothetical protein
VVGLTEFLAPQRVRAYYLVGSYASGEAIPSSDLDLIIVVKAGTSPAEVTGLTTVFRHCHLLSTVPLDLVVAREEDVLRSGAIWLRDLSQLVLGEDMRDRITAPDADDERRAYMHSAFAAVARHYPAGVPLKDPLGPPDPAGRYLGFDRSPVSLPEDGAAPGTRNLVSVTNWLATTLVLYHGGKLAYGKGERIERACREWVGGDWADLVGEVYRCCRNAWAYRVPHGNADGQRLRSLCERTLAFLNHFLAIYKEFLLAEIRPEMPARRFALHRLAEVLYPGPEVRSALTSLACGQDAFAAEAREVLAKLKTAELF